MGREICIPVGPADGKDAYGRIQLFWRPLSGLTIETARQVEPQTGSYRRRSPITLSVSTDLAAARLLDGRLMLLYAIAGEGNRLVRAIQQSPGSDEWYTQNHHTPGDRGTIVDLVVNPSGLVTSLTIGTAKDVFVSDQLDVNTWTDWRRVGNPDDLGIQLAAGINADGRLEIFLIGTAKDIYHCYEQTPGRRDWSGWLPFFSSDDRGERLVVGTNADGRLEVFVVGTAKDIYHTWQLAPSTSDQWSGWIQMQADVFGNELAVHTRHDGRLELFLLDMEGAPSVNYQLTPNGNWSGWQDFQTRISKSKGNNGIIVGKRNNGASEVFVHNSSEAAKNTYVVEHCSQDLKTGAWEVWQALPDPDPPPPPPAPEVQLSDVARNLVRLRWNGVSGANWEVQRRIANGPFNTVITTASSVYDDETVAPGQTYTYRVRGSNSVGTGPFSPEVQASPQVLRGTLDISLRASFSGGNYYEASVDNPLATVYGEGTERHALVVEIRNPTVFNYNSVNHLYSGKWSSTSVPSHGADAAFRNMWVEGPWQIVGPPLGGILSLSILWTEPS